MTFFNYESKTDEFLQTLARDILSGKAWSSYHDPSLQSFSFIFKFIGEDKYNTLKKNSGLIFEYMNKRFGQSGDIPIFFSFRWLDKPDYFKLEKIIQEIYPEFKKREDRRNIFKKAFAEIEQMQE